MNNDTDDEEVFSTSVCVRSGKGGGGGGRCRKKEFAGTNFVFLFVTSERSRLWESRGWRTKDVRRIFKLRQITNWFVIVEGRGLHFRKHLCVKDMKLTCLYNLETKGAFQKSELAGRTVAGPWPDHGGTSHFENE